MNSSIWECNEGIECLYQKLRITMASKKEKVTQLLANNRLLIGTHEPRSALISNTEYNGPSTYEGKAPPGLDPFGSILSIFGDYNLGTFQDRNKIITYHDYIDRKHKERKRKKHLRWIKIFLS